MPHQYTFDFPTTIQFGQGVVAYLGPHLLEQGLSHPLLVTDEVVATLPFFQKLIRNLDQQGVKADVYSELHKNPVKSDVLHGDQVYKECGCDCVVGIGGGVALDVARAIVLRVYHRRDLFDYDDLEGGSVLVTGRVPYFVTIPTTAGTGSEVGRSAIIAEDDTRKKRILFSPKLLARQVFADPELTVDLPAFITAATGMDALTHNIEAFLAKNYHPMCEGIALEGMRLIAAAIEKAVAAPDLQVRADMLLGSLMGAVAFQKGLGVVHSLAHPLSSLLDTHHGLANAVNLPYGMEFNYSGFEQKFDQMASSMGLGSGQGSRLSEYLMELNRRLGLPTKLREIGVGNEHLKKLSELAVMDFAHPNNPKPVTQEDFLMLYQKAL
ncbi:iron-containing alcohol dehydrogenase [Marinoscillum furvescens]|uniref:Alcohol dehydrogenase class IV n=1 Tax=Marinoscillum furvescens DSM 4134 TaxID=1122208 RepID=A0A3D9L6I2_MARFU|nr:iron-containing alcohol dehydrogenase [Marinoscillum furvescens]REE00568.1 alcohol dehydrogenase class IV [Marinoscillum furvescens DSM 4134]